MSGPRRIYATRSPVTGRFLPKTVDGAPALTEADCEAIVEGYRGGAAIAGLALRHGVHRSAVERILRHADFSADAGCEPIPPRARVWVGDIVDHAARVFGTSATIIRGRSRTIEVCGARFAVCLLAREMEIASLSAIGRALGRDHTTVIHGRDRCLARIAQDAAYARKVATLRWLVEGGPLLASAQAMPVRAAPISFPMRHDTLPIAEPAEPWWEKSDDDLIAEAIARHRAKGGDFVEVFS